MTSELLFATKHKGVRRLSLRRWHGDWTGGPRNFTSDILSSKRDSSSSSSSPQWCLLQRGLHPDHHNHYRPCNWCSLYVNDGSSIQRGLWYSLFASSLPNSPEDFIMHPCWASANTKTEFHKESGLNDLVKNDWEVQIAPILSLLLWCPSFLSIELCADQCALVDMERWYDADSILFFHFFLWYHLPWALRNLRMNRCRPVSYIALFEDSSSPVSLAFSLLPTSVEHYSDLEIIKWGKIHVLLFSAVISSSWLRMDGFDGATEAHLSYIC